MLQWMIPFICRACLSTTLYESSNSICLLSQLEQYDFLDLSSPGQSSLTWEDLQIILSYMWHILGSYDIVRPLECCYITWTWNFISIIINHWTHIENKNTRLLTSHPCMGRSPKTKSHPRFVRELLKPELSITSTGSAICYSWVINNRWCQ